MLDKNYVYIGVIVDYNNHRSLIVEKKKDCCDIYDVVDSVRLNNIPYDDLSIISSSDAKNYNRNIRSINCKSTSRIDKNSNKTFTYNDGSKVWFTSDTHFSHDNILRFCDRPYNTIEEMNDDLINRWNNVVGEDDTVFHLGDFAFGGSAAWVGTLEKLNGHIHLIVGNHDVKNIRENYHKYFESISYQQQIIVEGRHIYLNHYPFLTWAGIYRNDNDVVWQLFGHVHTRNNEAGADSSRLNYLLPGQYDVGVDNNNYQPINFTSIKKIITSRFDKNHEQ